MYECTGCIHNLPRVLWRQNYTRIATIPKSQQLQQQEQQQQQQQQHNNYALTMGVCTNCHNSQPRLKAGGLCNQCFNTGSAGNRNNANRTGTSASTDPDVASSIPNEKPINELTVGELKAIINDVNSQKINALTNRIKIIEDANIKKDQEIAVLKSTIVNMQRSINFIDNDTRKPNVIVTGLTEDEITPLGNNNVENDSEKIKALVNTIMDPNEPFNTDNWRVDRIGKPRPGFVRAIKVVTTSSEEKEKLLKIAH